MKQQIYSCGECDRHVQFVGRSSDAILDQAMYFGWFFGRGRQLRCASHNLTRVPSAPKLPDVRMYADYIRDPLHLGLVLYPVRVYETIRKLKEQQNGTSCNR